MAVHIYVGNDHGVVVKQQAAAIWMASAPGLPNMDVAELLYIPERNVLIAGTHGQGAWQLKVQ